MNALKKAFTLIEVNLAIMIMAGGILSILALYGLGFRETRQSREDVAASAYADEVMSPLIMALSSTNITWQSFNSIRTTPENGWGDYLRYNGTVVGNIQSVAANAYSEVMGKLGASGAKPSALPSDSNGGMKAGLVIIHEENSPVVKIAFRATHNAAELMAMPMFYTEVVFQGEVKPRTYKTNTEAE